MDDHARRRERDSRALSTPLTQLRLAQAERRAGRPQQAEALLDGLDTPDVSALRAALRLDQGDLHGAVTHALAAGDALSPSLGSDLTARLLQDLPTERLPRLEALHRAAGLGARALLAPFAEDPDRWVRVQVADVCGLTDDPDPLVRFVAQAGDARPAPGAQEPLPTRLFGGHGPDFESGYFIALELHCEARLRFLDTAGFAAIDGLLPDYPQRRVAFGEGYGLAFGLDAARGEVSERVEQLQRSGVLPFGIKLVGPRPFDVLGDLDDPQTTDHRLAKRYARDLFGHPARTGRAPGDSVHMRLCASFPPRGAPPDDVVRGLIDEGRAIYTETGARALERFVEFVRTERTRSPIPGGSLLGLQRRDPPK